jgi:hypothetical protein
MREWLRKLSFVEWIATAFVGVAALIAIYGIVASPGARSLAAWVPSLVCNLFTTGLTIYFVNSVFTRRDAFERDSKIRPAVHVVMLTVQPHVHAVLRQLNDPALRLGPIAGKPPAWTETAALVDYKMQTYQAVLDAEVTESFELIRNSLNLIAQKGISDAMPMATLESYMLLRPIVKHCDRLRQRFFPKGDEVLYGGMVPLLEEFRVKHKLPEMD